MTIKISEADYAKLWQPDNVSIQSFDLDAPQAFPLQNSSDITNICPQQFGRGYERWIQLRGISLLVIDEEFYDDLRVEYEAYESENLIEFGFNLSGTWVERAGGTNFLDWSVTGEHYQESFAERLSRERIRKVDIHLESSELLSSFLPEDWRSLPLELIPFLKKTANEHFYNNTSTITPAMRVAVEQILNCPFQGLTKHIYLEGKCLELIALKLEQLTTQEKKSSKSLVLKADDVERIHQAKEILIRNLEQPPSLLDLARQVGLNDYKLKLGFRQVFGTTVFRYLHFHRMEYACKLLTKKRMKVQDVARSVGYVNQSRFAAAFRKQFGVNPKTYQGW